MDRSGTNGKYGFRAQSDEVFFHYATHNGYGNTTDGPNPARFTTASPSGVALMADQPGEDFDQEFDAASDELHQQGWNHGDAGINVLETGLNVRWRTRIEGGVSGDNIYTAQDDGGGNTANAGTPGAADDSVLIHADPDLRYGG
jgi:hypothetical protein